MKKNLIYQGIGQLGSKAALYIFLLITARSLGTTEYGIFSFSLSLCYIISILMDFGLNQISVKWLARGEKEKYYIGFKGRFLTILLGLAIVLISSLLISSLFRQTFIILGVSFCGISLLNICYSYFRGIETMGLEAILSIFHRVLLLGLGILFFHYYKALSITASYAFLLSSSIALLLAFFVLYRFLPDLFTKLTIIKINQIFPILKESFPLMAVGFFGMIYYRVDILMLTYFQELSEVGLYSGAYKLMEGTFLLPSVIMAATFPRLSQYGRDKGRNFIHFWGKLFLIFLFLAVVVYISVRLFAPYLVEIILGAEYLKSIVIFKILIISLFAVYPGHLVTQTLIALDAQTIYMYVSIVGAFLNIGLNLILIPRYGSVGAAWATVIAEAIVTITCLLGIRYKLKCRSPALNPSEGSMT
jgi:O-antigen/teichoic acid export membrane protein